MELLMGNRECYKEENCELYIIFKKLITISSAIAL